VQMRRPAAVPARVQADSPLRVGKRRAAQARGAIEITVSSRLFREARPEPCLLARAARAEDTECASSARCVTVMLESERSGTLVGTMAGSPGTTIAGIRGRAKDVQL
jgi:hypothetical protein